MPELIIGTSVSLIGISFLGLVEFTSAEADGGRKHRFRWRLTRWHGRRQCVSTAFRTTELRRSPATGHVTPFLSPLPAVLVWPRPGRSHPGSRPETLLRLFLTRKPRVRPFTLPSGPDFTRTECCNQEIDFEDQEHRVHRRRGSSTGSTRPGSGSSSPVQWTPVRAAAEAAKTPRSPCPAPACSISAAAPASSASSRPPLPTAASPGSSSVGDLATAARKAAATLRSANVEIIHGNVTEIAFADYDAFYLYNPFEENMARGQKIDSAIPLSPALFKRYNNYVAAQPGLDADSGPGSSPMRAMPTKFLRATGASRRFSGVN